VENGLIVHQLIEVFVARGIEPESMGRKKTRKGHLNM
jgi:hypothetical protein